MAAISDIKKLDQRVMQLKGFDWLSGYNRGIRAIIPCPNPARFRNISKRNQQDVAILRDCF